MKVVVAIVLILLSLDAKVITVYGLLKERYNASLLRFYNPYIGYVDCPVYGLNSPDNISKTACEIEPLKFRKMAHYATLYMQNELHLEQKYRIDIVDGWCVIYKGAFIYNEQLIKSGNAFVTNWYTPKELLLLKSEMQRLENEATTKSRGLWHEWSSEMRCLKSESNSATQ